MVQFPLLLAALQDDCSPPVERLSPQEHSTCMEGDRDSHKHMHAETWRGPAPESMSIIMWGTVRMGRAWVTEQTPGPWRLLGCPGTRCPWHCWHFGAALLEKSKCPPGAMSMGVFLKQRRKPHREGTRQETKREDRNHFAKGQGWV